MQHNERGESVAQVYVALPQIRTDRRKVKPLPMFSHAKCTASQVLQLLLTDRIVSIAYHLPAMCSIAMRPALTISQQQWPQTSGCQRRAP